MTREEFTKDYALKILRSFRDCYDINSKLPNAWALDMAISALEQEPCETSTDEPMTMVYPTIFCDDTISRQLDAVAELKKIADTHQMNKLAYDEVSEFERDVLNFIEKHYLPSVNLKAECEDAISRAEMYEEIEDWLNLSRYYHPKSKNNKMPIDELRARIERLPSVQPSEDDIHREREQAYMLGYEDASNKYRGAAVPEWYEKIEGYGEPSVQPSRNEHKDCDNCKKCDESFEKGYKQGVNDISVSRIVQIGEVRNDKEISRNRRD